jgi:hypothetical protein
MKLIKNYFLEMICQINKIIHKCKISNLMFLSALIHNKLKNQSYSKEKFIRKYKIKMGSKLLREMLMRVKIKIDRIVGLYQRIQIIKFLNIKSLILDRKCKKIMIQSINNKQMDIN